MDAKRNALEREYDEVIAFIEAYVAFVSAILRRVPVSNSRLVGSWRKTMLNPLRIPDAARDQIPAVATPEEKGDPFYGVVMSELPTDALSDLVRARFPHARFRKIKRLHDLNSPLGSASGLSNLIGLVLGIVGAILRSLSPTPGPEPSTHTPLERVTFWVIVAAAVYFLVVMIPKWFRHSRSKATHKFADYVISYIAIIDE